MREKTLDIHWATEKEAERSWSQLRLALRLYARNRMATSGLVFVILIIAAALFAPWVAPYDPELQVYAETLQPPSLKHPLGTDDLGRDTFSRIIFGARASLPVGVISMSSAAIIGVLLGVVAGFYSGRVDTLIMRIMDAFLAFPALLLAIFLVAVLGPSLRNAMLAIVIVYIPAFARISRANVLSIKEKEYVEGARAIGATDWRIITQTVLPNIMSAVIVQVSLGIGVAILVEASLSFLGLGVQPPTPAWGSMLSQGRQLMTLAWWLTTFPGLTIFLTVLAFNFVGDGLRQALDPRQRR
jgi:ABC-type dipeptide/oligopeptide/nickel transport system permease subunit